MYKTLCLVDEEKKHHLNKIRNCHGIFFYHSLAYLIVVDYSSFF